MLRIVFQLICLFLLSHLTNWEVWNNITCLYLAVFVFQTMSQLNQPRVAYPKINKVDWSDFFYLYRTCCLFKTVQLTEPKWANKFSKAVNLSGVSSSKLSVSMLRIIFH